MNMLLMGNQAIALGAVKAGVGVVCGYPGTPSTEILQTIAQMKPEGVYVEWSVNEKSALEVAAGASYAGVRTLVTMKQVGLNVATDPLMSLAYVGVKGGMVIVVADDPGPISSQTEQDTRTFGMYSKLPVFDPSSVAEAYEMMADAYELSEKIGSPVIMRPTTRICHACDTVDADETRVQHKAEGFIKDKKWVIFPKLSFMNHQKIENRNAQLQKDLSSYRFNEYIKGKGRLGIAAGGVSYAYLREALGERSIPILKIATAHPFPSDLALNFLSDVDSVLVFEELDPVIERNLIFLCGKYGIRCDIRGKITGDVPCAGELSCEIVKERILTYLGEGGEAPGDKKASDAPKLPIRPPVLCAGCPHRASFLAVKRAMKGKAANFGGDIGCYTLGNAAPLEMVDTCLCMGAGITLAQGLYRAQPDVINFAFVGDSTLFAAGLTGIANAVYNKAKLVLCILDNSTTAMTGHQPNPSTGVRADGSAGVKLDIPKILDALGVGFIETADPLNQTASIDTVSRAAAHDGVSAIIFKSPCIAVEAHTKTCVVDNEKCIGCKMCITQVGCPAISMSENKAKIDADTCRGCMLCETACKKGAIIQKEVK